MKVVHAFAPVYDAASRKLLLGTMPSPQSVRHGFYYSHPQNRFWPLLARLFGEEHPPVSPEQKRAFALRHQLALWDVLATCEIRGAADASIRQPVPNDIPWLLQQAPITHIFTTGKMAHKLYEQLVFPVTRRHAIYLPSTSPANQAHFPFDKLLETWKETLCGLGC